MTYVGLEDTLDRVYNLVCTPLEGYRDLFVHEGLSSLSYENDLPNSLEHAHVSIVSSPPSSYSPNMRLMSPLIIRRFVSLMWMWAIRIACLICLVEM